MNYEIKKIDLWSAIKISFLINGIVGLAIGLLIGLVFAFIISFVSQMVPSDNPELANIPFGPLGGFFIGLIYALFIAVGNGIIITGIFVMLYNLFAGWIGGFKIEVEQIQPEPIKPTMTLAEKQPDGSTSING